MTGASPAIEFSALTDSDLADSFSELHRQVELFQPTIDAHEKAKAEVKRRFEDRPAEEAGVLQGKKWDVQVSAKSNERSWTSMLKLYRALKRQKFLEICSVAFKAAEQVIGEEAVAKLVTITQCGSRRLKPVLKQAA